MNIFKRIEKQKEFIEETSAICNKLMNLQLKRIKTHQKPSKEIIEREFFNFYELLKKAKEDGIANGYVFHEQRKTLIEVFKLFEDVVPEFKELK